MYYIVHHCRSQIHLVPIALLQAQRNLMVLFVIFPTKDKFKYSTTLASLSVF